MVPNITIGIFFSFRKISVCFTGFLAIVLGDVSFLGAGHSDRVLAGQKMLLPKTLE